MFAPNIFNFEFRAYFLFLTRVPITILVHMYENKHICYTTGKYVELIQALGWVACCTLNIFNVFYGGMFIAFRVAIVF